MALAASTPTVTGLYINSLKISSTDASPYSHLLGQDGLGNYTDNLGATYNKLDQLFAWMQFYGYNYAILYDTSSSDFVSGGAASETFTATGKTRLRALIDKARTYGITYVGVVCDLFQPSLSPPRYDGTSQIRKIFDYNIDPATTITQRVDWINIETEFWNFLYNPSPSNGAAPSKFRYEDDVPGVSYDYSAVRNIDVSPIGGVGCGTAALSMMNATNVYACHTSAATNVVTHAGAQRVIAGLNISGTGILPGTQVASVVNATTFTITQNATVTANSNLTLSGAPYAPLYSVMQIWNPSNTAGYEYRQIVNFNDAEVVQIDRDLPTNLLANPCGWFNMNFISNDGTLDYKTYLTRLTACWTFIQNNKTTFLNSSGTRVEIEAYIGFPDYDANVGVTQLQSLAAFLDRTLLTCYTPIPNYSYIDGNYKHKPVGVNAQRVTDDLAKYIKKINRLGAIVSIESATSNNAKCAGVNFAPPGYHTDFNFSGYFMEGRSNAGASSGGTVNTARPENVSTGPRIAVTAPGGTVYDTCSSSGAPQYPGGLQAPPANITAKSITDTWEYIITDPGPVGTPAYSTPTYNEYLNTATAPANNVSARILFDTIIVFDQEYMRQLVINPPLDLVLTIVGTDPTCNGYTDGTASVSASGGQAPYTYLWDDLAASTTDTITGLAAGVYTCTVTDATLTTSSISVTLTDPTTSSLDVTPHSFSCIASTGYFTIETNFPYYSVVPSGDTPTVWIANPSTGSPFNTPAIYANGAYDVWTSTTSPSTGCNGFVSLFMDPPSGPSISATSINSLCGSGHGSITASITVPSTGPYTYYLTNSVGFPLANNTSGIFANLIPLTYKVYAVDANGCSSSILTKVITAPTPPTITAVGTPPSCLGGLDGSVVITASGSSGYTYFLTGQPSQSTNTFTNLGAGSYTAHVTDTNGCTSNSVVVLLAQGGIPAANYIVNDIPEDETDTGSIVLDSVYGTPPFSYTWSNGANTDSIYNLAPGTYSVTIIDANGCQISYTFLITKTCDDFSNLDFKAYLEDLKCCLVSKSKDLILSLRIGDKKATKCLLPKIRLINMLVNRLEIITDLTNNECLSCEEGYKLLRLIKELCDCKHC